MMVSLWVFIASNESQGALHCVYARTEDEARACARPWLAKQVRRGLLDVTAKQYLHGFIAGSDYWPGYVEQASGSEEDHATAEE
jgi:hypothetical protein